MLVFYLEILHLCSKDSFFSFYYILSSFIITVILTSLNELCGFPPFVTQPMPKNLSIICLKLGLKNTGYTCRQWLSNFFDSNSQ